MQQWVAVYQQSIGEFVAGGLAFVGCRCFMLVSQLSFLAGYKEGRQEARPPAPGEAAADDRPSPLEAFNEFSKQQPEAKSAAPPPSQSKSDATPRPPDAQA